MSRIHNEKKNNKYGQKDITIDSIMAEKQRLAEEKMMR